MKERFLQLIGLFKAARPATRITLVGTTLAIFAMALGSSWYAGRPDLVQLWSGLSSSEAADYKSALAQADIPFRSSPPPENGIWVDVSQRTAAEAQVALTGYKPAAKGIQIADGGIDSAFMSARSRDQMAEKREWQECEWQLEHLGFVERATVTKSSEDHSVFGGPTEATISVTLGLRNGVVLDPTQARTVAALVRTCFNVPMENITIVDERGNLLHDGSESTGAFSDMDLFAQKRRYDNDAERRANHILEMALGKGMAQVTVNSVWIYDEFETIKESALPDESAPFYESKTESKSSGAKSLVGGPVGVSSNITQDFGNGNAGVGASDDGGGTQNSKSEEKRVLVGRSTEHRSSRTPRITRLSVALVADESVAAGLEKLEGMVKASVGFDETRPDFFQSYTTKLASVERDDEGNPVPPQEPEPVEEPNRYLQLALEHGVEVVAALTFIFVLLKSLRGAKSAVTGTAATAHDGRSSRFAGQAAEEDAENRLADIDPDLLARVQVEELVRSDPEKVSEILAEWAAASQETAGAGK